MWKKEKIDNLVQQYAVKDLHLFPDWMAIAKPDNEVRYDYESSRICYSLIRHFKPVSCLEFGTSFGHSTIFITDALLRNKKPFQFVASEMYPDLRTKARDNLLRRHGKVIPLLVGKIEENWDKIPDELDFVFIDTNHDAENTKWYIQNVFPRCKKRALIAIHDWAVREDENGNWITKGEDGHSVLEENNILIDLHKQGELPLEKLYWTYDRTIPYEKRTESSFWLKT